jgi:regulator of protease activity HflC (stomatin/prohibitin superfamily)
MKLRNIIATLMVATLTLAVLWVGFQWTVNRIYVPEGKSLMLRYKGPLIFGHREAAKPGQFAKPGQIGVMEQLRGPGRHFYCPVWWERTVVDDVVIQPGQVGVVTSRMGEVLKQTDLLVDGDLKTPVFKGTLRKVLAPGRYRLNPYAFEVVVVQTVSDKEKYSGWVEIPSGYVGVVTYLAENPQQRKSKGIQNSVLPPGLYPINPREQQIDVVGIGYSETSIEVKRRTDSGGAVVHDDSGEPLAEPQSGINFPSNDGFNIQIDFTAVWGVMPDQACDIVRDFGNLDAVEQKVILPQSESICRNQGSKMGAVELLVGETRQAFQDETSEKFKDELEEKHVTLLYGLVRHTYIPREVRFPIQEGYIADEQKLTREQEQLTAKAEAKLREAEQKVQLETETIKAETSKMIASVVAEGEKEAQEKAAETKQLVAVVDKKIAEFDAQKTVKLGEANAKAEQLQAEAKASKFGLAVEAFGTPSAYNKWEFAEGLPASIDLQLFYAGEGTLWTDLKGLMPTVPLRPVTPAPSTKPAR